MLKTSKNTKPTCNRGEGWKEKDTRRKKLITYFFSTLLLHAYLSVSRQAFLLYDDFPKMNSSVLDLIGIRGQIGSTIKYSEYKMLYYKKLSFET
jgi:hypothetical protein